MLKLAYVGGLGMMAGPAAVHLTPCDVAQVVRVHDRGSAGGLRDQYRAEWDRHGAARVDSFAQLVGDGDIDGVVVCAGKNGDDLPLIAELASLLMARCKDSPFILHLSTVSPDFAEAASRYCRDKKVSYANYPLTGGPLGAKLGGADPKGMLILASGDEALYQRVQPLLQKLGHPRYFGSSPSAGSVTKLIGHCLVFNGLVGIATGTAVHSEYFNGHQLGGDAQADFLTFLNGGAGGTRQWDVGMRKGVKESIWDAGFSIHHAVVDAIYLAKLTQKLGLPRFAVQSIINTALAFSYVLDRYPGQVVATHAIVREMLHEIAGDLDLFMEKHGALGKDLTDNLNACIASLPKQVCDSVLLTPRVVDFAEIAQ